MIINALKNTIFENVQSSNGSFKKHFHDTYTIGLTHGGCFKSINSNKASYSCIHSTRIINPYETHFGDSKEWKYTNFYPNIALLSSIYEDIFFEKKVPIFEKHIINDIELYKLLFELFTNIYTKQDSMKIEISLINSLSYLIKNYTKKTKLYDKDFNNNKIISTAKEFINDSLKYNISLDSISQNVSLSKYHFLRVFKEEVNLTPHQYILMQRVNKAKDLIISGQTLVQASLNVGFNDQSHFIRNFRKMYGYSPKMLLKKDNFVKYK